MCRNDTKKASIHRNACRKCVRYQEEQLLETLSEQIGSSYEERSAVAFEAVFELPGDRAEAPVVEIVVIPDVEGRARIWIPSKEELSSHVPPQRIVIDAGTDEREAGELIGRPHRKDVCIECHLTAVVPL